MSNEAGQWSPKRDFELELDDLEKLARGYAVAPEADISSWLPAADVERGKAMMKMTADAWQAVEAFPTETLIALVRFFTLAEMQLPGWDGGKDSPVIPLVRLLKARDDFTPDLRRWIKANTDNRYLPYGSAL